MWKKLVSIKHYVIISNLVTTASDYVIDLLRECMHTIGRLMISPHTTINKVDFCDKISFKKIVVSTTSSSFVVCCQGTKSSLT